MNSQNISDPDKLRPANRTAEADPRNLLFVSVDSNNQAQQRTIEDQHNEVSCYSLEDYVPEKIRTFFETTKNIYLYSWHVYRFYPIAQQQALICIEFALKEKYPEKQRACLRKLLKHAINRGDLKNEGFSSWHDNVERRSIDRYEHEQLQKMQNENLEQIELDYSQIVISEEDQAYDYLSIIKENIPSLRNIYAHGTNMLHRNSLLTIELACELINQLFSPSSS